VRFRETASTVVDINEKLTNFPVLREKNSNNTGHDTRLYVKKNTSGNLTPPKYSCK